MTNLFKSLALTLSITLAAFTSPSLASTVGDPTVLPGSTQVGQPANGSDAWTQAMGQLGLFRVHRDDCDVTSEIFIEIYTDDNSIQFGICMDKDESSSGTKEWEDARDECLSQGKRLPEPAEFKFACQSGAGFSNMTDDIEWVSNFAEVEPKHNGGMTGIATAVAGAGCKIGAYNWVTRSSSFSHSNAFRCVR